MAASERPETADERLVIEALHRAFSEPVDAAAVQAGRDAIQVAAELAAAQADAERALVDRTLVTAFGAPLDGDAVAAGAEKVRAVAQRERAVGRRLVHSVTRHAAAALVVVIALGGMSGVAAASSSALPGEALYSVKRAVERVMLTAAITPHQQARLQAKLAQRRLNEAATLLASGADAEAVEPLLSEAERHVAVAREFAAPDMADEVAALEQVAEDIRNDSGETTVAGPPQPGGLTATPVPDSSSESSVATTADERQTGEVSPSTTPTDVPTGTGATATGPRPASSTRPSASPSPTPSPTPTRTPDPTPTAKPEPSPEPSRPSQSDSESPSRNELPDRRPPAEDSQPDDADWYIELPREVTTATPPQTIDPSPRGKIVVRATPPPHRGKVVERTIASDSTESGW